MLIGAHVAWSTQTSVFGTLSYTVVQGHNIQNHISSGGGGGFLKGVNDMFPWPAKHQATFPLHFEIKLNLTRLPHAMCLMLYLQSINSTWSQSDLLNTDLVNLSVLQTEPQIHGLTVWPSIIYLRVELYCSDAWRTFLDYLEHNLYQHLVKTSNVA